MSTEITILETNRLLLLGLRPERINFIFNHLPKSEIMQTMGHRSEEDFLKEEYKHKNGYSSYNRTFILFLMKEKCSGHIIGRCGLHNWNTEHRRAEIGYVMEDELYKNMGYMTESVKAVLSYGFNDLSLNRIEALVDIKNEISIKILNKFGFRKEGILRQHICNNNTSSDSLIFALLKEEYS